MTSLQKIVNAIVYHVFSETHSRDAINRVSTKNVNAIVYYVFLETHSRDAINRVSTKP